MIKENEKVLILAPNAGFGNRIRAIASGIIAAKYLNRKFYLAWDPLEPTDHRPNVAAMQKCGWHELFDCTIAMANKDTFPVIDVYYSEWVKGEFWYNSQNYGERVWNITPSKKVLDNIDALFYDTSDVILLETSLDVKFSFVHEIIFKHQLSYVYQQYFFPSAKYLERLANCEKYDIGISIRKGDLSVYFPEANQRDEDIEWWILHLNQNYKIAVFSDDPVLCDRIRNLINTPVNIDTSDMTDWQDGFLQFLCLSRNCEIICGTPRSSFAEQASIFGNKPYYRNLDIIEKQESKN